MKERFEIYDGSAEAKKAKGKSKNLSGAGAVSVLLGLLIAVVIYYKNA